MTDFNADPTPINGYPLQFFSGEHNPEAGGGEYFIGASPMGIDLFGQYATSVYPLHAGHIRRFVFQIRVRGTLGSAEPGRLYLSQGEIYLELTGAGHEICSGAHSVNGEVYWDQLLCVVHGDLERGPAPQPCSRCSPRRDRLAASSLGLPCPIRRCSPLLLRWDVQARRGGRARRSVHSVPG